MGTKKGGRGRPGEKKKKGGGGDQCEETKKMGGGEQCEEGKKKINPKSSKNVNSDVRTYFKVFASFRCSNISCKKSWHSAHAWEREDDEGGINCDICQRPAELVNAVDETLKLDTYICGCENIWQSIHVEENSTVPQECDICGLMVLPDGQPQERFGRHYWLQCLNKECPEKDNVEWEDFSLSRQKTQRCTKCFSRGDIFKISKLKQLPKWALQRQYLLRLRGLRAYDENDKEEKPTNHVSEFCEMCQDIIRQGKGKNCRQWRMIKTKLKNEPDGSEREEIIELNHVSLNPFHFDTKPKVDVIAVRN